MLVVTIEDKGKKTDPHLLECLRQHICYHISDELDVKLQSPGWNGYSGGDDAYFGLSGKTVKVVKKES